MQHPAFGIIFEANIVEDDFTARGKINDIRPPAQQSNTLFLALDAEWKNWAINFGVGRGLNNATDQWTVKAIIGIAF